MASKVTASDIREAAAFIKARGLAGTITPALLARSSRELGKDFAEVLGMVGDMLMQDQGRGPSPEASKYL